MLGTITSIAEVAAVPTAVQGVDSSTWTPLTAIAGFIFGPDAFHGDFAPLPIAAGVAAVVMFSVLFGLPGVALILVTQGRRCGVMGAVTQGIAYGLFLQVFFMCLIVNGVQDQLTVYESAPRWGWWVAHAAFGATLGAVTSLQLERRQVAL